MTISFAGKVAIVTGAGGGLGREYALELARRGARVVVNDLGGARDGLGQSGSAAMVAEEIRLAGGEALSDSGNVADYAQMVELVEKATDAWGGVHILINNAGILRDKSFAKMEVADFEEVVRVHLLGSANATKAVWDQMRAQNYGRILMTASSSGLYGNFGQTNYGAAKLGLAGLTKSLHLEGAKYDIRVNTLAPIASTRMTGDILPPETLELFHPANVVPAALFLVSGDAPTNVIVGAGAGLFHAVNITMTQGVMLPEGERTVEAVAAHWDAICERTGEMVPLSGAEQFMTAIRNQPSPDCLLRG